jgi:RNA polymerase sigma factor (sigma-70 family)
VSATAHPQSAPDLAWLFTSHASHLRHTVRRVVEAPDEVVEDACQFAWSTLIGRGGPRCTDATLSWLVTTAVREAAKLIERESRELPLDEELETVIEAPGSGPYELLEAQERIAALAALPERQRRLVWLHALGLTYAEMAIHEGCTRRAVERHLLRAKDSIRAIASE